MRRFHWQQAASGTQESSLPSIRESMAHMRYNSEVCSQRNQSERTPGMCLLALFFRSVEDAPLVVGANREEAYERGGEPPQILPGPRQAVGGRDPVAGGTWLAVNDCGVLIAVTNRLKTRPPEAPPSRGVLARELLACSTAAVAMDVAARELSNHRYAGCNVVCADADNLLVLHAADWLRIRPMPPGLHVLTSHDVNDGSDPRLAYAARWLSQRPFELANDCVVALQQLCAQTGNGDPAMCLHGKKGGTVSSSIFVLRRPLRRSNYYHAQGPPDRTPYADYSHLLQQLSHEQ
jgi:hypothetical protein